MHKTIKTVGAGVAALATVALTATSANADSSIIKIGKYGELSATHNIAWIKTKVICSDDTESARLTASLTQVTHGSVQGPITGSVTSISAFECSGEEEVVYVPVRRPAGGYKWVTGAARVNQVTFETWGHNGANYDSNTLGGRTVYLR